MKKKILKITLLAFLTLNVCTFYSCGTDSEESSEIIDPAEDPEDDPAEDPEETDSIVDPVEDPEESPMTMTLVTSDEIKSIPCPTLGKRWVVNWDYTDEFNDDKLDDSKWYDYHPTWKGRAPGYFSPDNVNVKDGYLQINGGIPDEPIVVTNWDKSTTTYTKTCGACVSKKTTASYGYYECKFKANKTTLSSTFWFSSRGNFDSPMGGTFGEELDVCECIGRTGDFSGNNMYDGMNSNIHYWYSPSDGNTYDMRAAKPGGASWESGFDQDLPDGDKPSDNFHTYGCWWYSSTAAAFFLDNNEGVVVPFNFKLASEQPTVDVTKCEINHPMGMNMVVETYPSPWVELPTDEEITDPSKNTTLYDWVRSYKLADADEPNVSSQEMYMFEKHINCLSKPNKSSKDLNVNVVYTAPRDCKMRIIVYNDNKDSNGNNEIVTSKDYDAYAGYSNNEYLINTDAVSGERYYVFCYLLPTDFDSISDAYEVDSYMTIIE